MTEAHADKLGLAQPNVSDYGRGILRLNADLILKLTGILKVSADELLGLREPKITPSVRNRRLARRLDEIERLPRRDQEALLRINDFLFLQPLAKPITALKESNEDVVLIELEECSILLERHAVHALMPSLELFEVFSPAAPMQASSQPH